MASRNLGPPRRAAQGPAAGMAAADAAGAAAVGARGRGRPRKTDGADAVAAGTGPIWDGTAPGSCDEADAKSGGSSSGEEGSGSEGGQGEETEDSAEVDGEGDREQEVRDEPSGGWSGQEGTGSDEEGGSPVAGEGPGRRGRQGQGQGRQRGQGRQGRGRGRGRGRGGPSGPVTRGAVGHASAEVGAPRVAGAAAGGGRGGNGGAASPGRRLGQEAAAGVEAGAAVWAMGVLEVEADSPADLARGSPGCREVRVLGLAGTGGPGQDLPQQQAAPLQQHKDQQEQHAGSQQPTKPGQVWRRRGRLGLGSGLARGPLTAAGANKLQGLQQGQ